MGLTDRFGGPAAWDRHCAAQDAEWLAVKRLNPGCGTCEHGIKCPDCRSVYCKEQDEWIEWVHEFDPPCDYEGWSER